MAIVAPLCAKRSVWIMLHVTAAAFFFGGIDDGSLVMPSVQGIALPSIPIPQSGSAALWTTMGSRSDFVKDVWSSSLLAAAGVTDASDTSIICNSGGLLAEQAVTGAYNQKCMMLSQRQVPLQIPGSSIKNLQIRQEAAASGSTGLAVWNSGLLLVRLLQELPCWTVNDQKPQCVMELGCGTGLASIACSALGAPKVLATDGNPKIVALATENAALNQCQNSLETQVLPWGQLNAIDYSEEADLIIGSDLTYNSGTWPVLAETMSTIVTPNGHVLYVSCGHEGFNVQAEVDGFVQVAQQAGLETISSIYGVEVSKLLPQLLSARESQILAASGGARVLVLRRKPVLRKS